MSTPRRSVTPKQKGTTLAERIAALESRLAIRPTRHEMSDYVRAQLDFREERNRLVRVRFVERTDPLPPPPVPRWRRLWDWYVGLWTRTDLAGFAAGVVHGALLVAVVVLVDLLTR